MTVTKNGQHVSAKVRLCCGFYRSRGKVLTSVITCIVVIVLVKAYRRNCSAWILLWLWGTHLRCGIFGFVWVFQEPFFVVMSSLNNHVEGAKNNIPNGSNTARQWGQSQFYWKLIHESSSMIPLRIPLVCCSLTTLFPESVIFPSPGLQRETLRTTLVMSLAVHGAIFSVLNFVSFPTQSLFAPLN